MSRLDLNEKFDANGGSDFKVLPEGEYEATCKSVEKKLNLQGDVRGVIIKMSSQGSAFQEYVGFEESGGYTLDIIKWKIAMILISFGVRKHGDKVNAADLLKLGGEKAKVLLKKEQFESNSTPGKMLDGNKVEKWIDSAKADTQKTSKPEEAAAADSKKGEDDDIDW